MALHPIFAEILAPYMPPARDTYRGWEIRRGRWPEPEWMATGPNYDAWGDSDGWEDNGEKADAPTREALIEEIDDWFERNSDSDGSPKGGDAEGGSVACDDSAGRQASPEPNRETPNV